MKYVWVSATATLADPQPTHEPPQVEDVLNRLEEQGYEIFTVLPIPGINGFPRAKVVARKVSDEG